MFKYTPTLVDWICARPNSQVVRRQVTSMPRRYAASAVPAINRPI